MGQNEVDLGVYVSHLGALVAYVATLLAVRGDTWHPRPGEPWWKSVTRQGWAAAATASIGLALSLASIIKADHSAAQLEGKVVEANKKLDDVLNKQLPRVSEELASIVNKASAMHAALEGAGSTVEEIKNDLPILARSDQLKGLATMEQVRRLATSEQVRSLATTEDVKRLATSEQVRSLATAEDVKRLATAEQLRRLATVEDVKHLATAEQVKTLATSEELKRLATAEQVKTLATSEDLRRLATSDQVQQLATREEVNRLATGEQVRMLATGEDLKRLATSEQIQRLPTLEDLKKLVTSEDVKKLLAPLQRDAVVTGVAPNG